MRPIPVLIAGGIAAALGAALWGVIGYYLHVEVGWVAVIIGVVVGLVCCAAAADEADIESGVIAAGLTVLAIAGGKLAMAYALTHQYSERDYALSALADEIRMEQSQQGKTYQFPQGVDPGTALGQADYPEDLWAQAEAKWSALHSQEQADLLACPSLANPDYVLSYLADDVVEEWRQAGRELHWPGGEEPEAPTRGSQYPPDIWSDAQSRWDALSDQAKRQRIDYIVQTEGSPSDASFFWDVFKDSFGVLDIVFVGVGILAGFKFGSGLSTT